MKQLSGLDASFLYMESPNTYGHINGLGIYQYPSEDFDPFTVVRDRFNSMTGHLEPFRRRLVEVPMGLDHPYWIDDPEFDIDYHVREIGLAAPGSRQQLSDQVARIIGRKMDRTRPLWEVYVITGLYDGRWALLTKTHHATVDGASGVMMLKLMTESSADEPWKYEPIDWSGEPIPDDAELLARTVSSLVRKPVKAARLNLRMVRSLADAAGIDGVSSLASKSRDALASIVGRSPEAAEAQEQLRRVSIPVTPAPPTPWNRRITPHRRFAMRSTALDNIKALKDATGGTVNDVVMAMCTGALRRYLIEHDALPDQPLRAMVPVSIRTGEEDDPWTNLVSSIIAELPTDEPDPLQRVQRCRDAMGVAKEQLTLLPADSIMEATQATSPVVAGSAIRLAQRLADRVRMSANVVISNVPGPREPLYYAGAKLDHYIPISTITSGIGLNVTVHSYEDRLDFGLVADRELVPDLEHLVDLHIEELVALFEASGAEWAVPFDPDDPAYRSSDRPGRSARSGGASSATSKRSSAKKPSSKKSGPKQSAPKKSSAKKSSAKKSTKKSSAKKSSAKKSTKKSADRKSATKRSAGKKKPTSKKAGSKKSSAKKPSSKKKTASKQTSGAR